MSTVEPLECPNCHAHLVVLSPEWKDGAPTGRQTAECRSCGPVDLKAVENAAGEEPRVVEDTERDAPAKVSDSETDKPAAKPRSTAKKS